MIYQNEKPHKFVPENTVQSRTQMFLGRMQWKVKIWFRQQQDSVTSFSFWNSYISLFKDFFHFPPVSWVASVWANVNVIFRVLKKCQKWASRERLEICCKCTWTKSTFPRFADSKVASKARCPFCAFPGNKLYWGLFLDLKKKKHILGWTLDLKQIIAWK